MGLCGQAQLLDEAVGIAAEQRRRYAEACDSGLKG